MALPRGYKHTNETKQARSNLMKQKWKDSEYRELILESRIGKMKPWNKGKRGVQVGWSKGKTFAYKPRISMRGRFLGSKSPRWKGGVTNPNTLERKKFQQTIQKQVFERDNYTCQMCNSRGGHIQVDHIQSWAKYVEGRFSIDNCRTLCDKCHYKVTFCKDMPDNIKVWGHNLKYTNLERVRV